MSSTRESDYQKSLENFIVQKEIENYINKTSCLKSEKLKTQYTKSICYYIVNSNNNDLFSLYDIP